MRLFRLNAVQTIAVLLALAAFGAGCKKTIVDPFPATGAVAGWEKVGESRTFAAKDLSQYIDGDAEQYIAAGVVTTSTADYKYQGQLEATVDVHTMRDAAGATAIFAKEPADGKSVPIGDAAMAHGQSVVFRKGATLVRIVAFQATPGAEQALQALASAIAAKL